MTTIANDENKPWMLEPYVGGMQGAENLVFDGEGALFVSGLNGFIYKILPTDNIFKGTINQQLQLGSMCLGIAVAGDGMIYIAVDDYQSDGVIHEGRHIIQISRDFSRHRRITDKAIPGLNGFTLDGRGDLYYSSSEGLLSSAGAVYKIANPANTNNFNDPVEFISDVGRVNGLAFTSDYSKLYYSETFNGLWVYDLKSQKKHQLISKKDFAIVDDLVVDKNNTVWLTVNSTKSIVAIRGADIQAYRFEQLGAPSSCQFGKGYGFSEDILYVTEFGKYGGLPIKNGRGVWAIPLAELSAIK